jgi:hypothetical protein
LAALEAKDRDFGESLCFSSRYFWLVYIKQHLLFLSVHLQRETDIHSSVETLKLQASQQAAEYNRLADEYNEATGAKSDKRRD